MDEEQQTAFLEQIGQMMDGKIAVALGGQQPSAQESTSKPASAQDIADLLERREAKMKEEFSSQQLETNFNLHLSNKNPDFVNYLNEATDTLGDKVMDRIAGKATLEERVAAVDAYEKQYLQAAASSGLPVTEKQRKAQKARADTDGKYQELFTDYPDLGASRSDKFFALFEQDLANVADAA